MKQGERKVTAYEIKQALAEKHYKDFFLTEVKSGSTWLARAGDMKILDGLAIRKSWTSPCFTGYEVKVSRGDFLRDAKFYTYTELCNCLYIVCPKGMIDRTELPESVGLMYYDPEKKTLTTRKKAIFRKIEYSPELLLYIIYSRLDSDRYPFFSDKKSYFDAYLAGNIDNRVLGHAVKSKLIQDNIRLEHEVETLRCFEKTQKEYQEIRAVLENHKIYGWRMGGIAAELDKALSRKPIDDVKSIRESLERVVEILAAMEGSPGGKEGGSP